MTFFEKIVLEKLSQYNGSLFNFLNLFKGLYIGEIYNILLDIKNQKIKTIEQSKFKSSEFIKEFQLPFDLLEYKTMLHEINYFPVPHILDSDWRFTRNSSFRLLEKIKEYSKKTTDNFIMIGAPSIFSLLENRIDANFAKLLIDQNYIYSGNIRKNNIICNDIGSFELYDFTDIILCDPPWYLPAIKNFIKKSFMMMRFNSFLFIALPPVEVRETIEEEYKEIDSFSKNLGLELISEDDSTIEYVSPPFEVNSLLSLGITHFPINWRKGKLRIYKKNNNIINKMENSNIIYPDKWYDVTINNVRIKTRIIKNESYKPLKCIISSIVKNDIFPTVSMRTGKQNEVDIWTSGNRVYKCSNNQDFISICKSISQSGIDNFRSILNDDNMDVIMLLNDLVSKENEEYADVWSKL
jgi:hypothetical protein